MNKNLSKRNILIAAIILIIVGIVILMIKFNLNNDNKTNTNDNNGNASNIPKNAYQTSDGKYILKLVEVSDEKAENDARERYGEENFEQQIKQYAVLYAYLNDNVFVIDAVSEDDNYGLYSFVGLPTEEYGHRILVNKKTRAIEVSSEDLKKVGSNCLRNGFCGFQSQVGYIKGSTGYYFINNDNGLVTIYTNNWKKIGYVLEVNNISIDADGNIDVYEKVEKTSCNGEYCYYTGIGETIKVDANGNRK